MLSLEFTPKLTREYLLEKNSEETYMSYYLGIPVTKGLFISPLRYDKHKTCSYFRGKSGTLYFKDFATGQCLDFINVYMTKFGCTYYEAIKGIAKDFGYIKGTSPPKAIKIQPKFEGTKQTFIQVEIKEFTEAELKWWSSFGISKEILQRFNVHSCKTVFLNGRVFAQSHQAAPIYGYYFGKKENIEQWRLYFPKNQNNGYKFLGNVGMKTIQGYKQLPKTGKLLIITKSQKDVMCLHALGITAIAPNSENFFVGDKMLEELKKRFKYIVLLYDLDGPGIRASKKIKKEYPELIVTLLPREKKCKDISDFFKTYGRENTLKMIQSKISAFKNDSQLIRKNNF